MNVEKRPGNENQPATLVGDREIVAIRTFDAPRKLVFGLWTDPKHLAQWWGPRGFTTTTFKMDVKPGGVWRFVMHGPDGRDYENKITYLEVVEPEKLVYKHGGDKDVEPVNFQVTTTFEEVGNKTRLTMRMQFPSSIARDYVVKTYCAVEGLTQTLGRLDEQIANEKSGDQEFIISRAYNASRETVWNAWTQRDHLLRWFGPKGFKMTAANLDFRPGGMFHYSMETPDGKQMWGKFVFREIIPQQRIVWVNSFSDPKGGVTRHPFTTDPWPMEMLTMVTFAEHEGATIVTVHWHPINATEAERAAFDRGRGSMTMGWTGTYDRLTEYLKA